MFQPTARELQFLINRRAEYENNTRTYRRFWDFADLERYYNQFGGHFFDSDSMRFFNSKIGMIFHGDSPADFNIFITSERDTYTNQPRRYTVRQLQIDGSIKNLSGFQAFSTSKAAQAAIRRYLASGTPFISAGE